MVTKKYTIPKHKKIKVGKHTKKIKNQYGGVLEQNIHRRQKLRQAPSKNYLYYTNNSEPKSKYYGYKPIQLNAAIFQYLFDNGLLSFYSDVDNNKYLGFDNFPSIVETIESIKKISKATENRDFTLIYEGDGIPIISREDHLHNLNTNSKFVVNVKKINYSIKPSLHITEQNKGKIYVPNRIKTETATQISQDVQYVKKLMQDLPHIVESLKKTKIQNKTSTDICDLSYSTDDFLIIDQSDYENVGSVVIVGYPSEINPFLKLEVPKTRTSENNSTKVLLIDLLKETIFEEQKKNEDEDDNYCKLLVELYNSFQLDEAKKIDAENPDDFYKLLKLNLKVILEYLKKFITNEIEDILQMLKTKEFEGILKTEKQNNSSLTPEKLFGLIEKKINDTLKERIKGCFTRPNINIRYVFHPFILEKKTGKYEPLIYNVRELTKDHQPILDRILTLIQTEIPKRFGILNGDETSYTNFYSYYRFGDIFHIKSIYIHPTKKSIDYVDTYSHVIKRSINLEELIYSSGITTLNGNPFWSELKFEYDIRNYRFYEDKEASSRLVSKKFTKGYSRKYSKTFFRTKKNTSTNTSTNKSTNKIQKSETEKKFRKISTDFKNVKIICIREIIGGGYELYFKCLDDSSNVKFYYIKLIPILDELGNIKTQLKKYQTVYNCFNNVVNIYEIQKPIYQIEVIEINDDLRKNKDKVKELNFFAKSWNFVLLRLASNNKFLTEIPIFKILNKFYPYVAYNILKSDKQTSDFVNLEEAGKCKLTKFCTTQEYNFKITFDFKEKEYILVINKYETKSGTAKYVVWIFPYNDTFISDNRIPTYKELRDPEFVKKVIDILVAKKLYDESTHFLAINTFVAYIYQSLHFHILPKLDYYNSSTESELVLSTELRLYSVLNLYYKLKIFPDYYHNLKNEFKYGPYFTENLF